jgi:hypothetical protein
LRELIFFILSPTTLCIAVYPISRRTNSIQQKMNKPSRRFILRSLAATATGWLIPPAIVYAFPMGGTLLSGPTGSPAVDSVLVHIIGFLWFSCMMGLWVGPTWLLVVLPLTLFVPEKSKFWHPLIIGPFGLISGGFILVASVAFITRGPGELQIKSLLPMAGIASVVGLLTALMLAYLFRRKEEPNQITTASRAELATDP